MKKISLVLLASLALATSLSFAASCPRIQDIQGGRLPPGWTYLLGPDGYASGEYEFSSAIHSLNGSFYYEQVICRYATCPSFGCAAFTLLSEARYREPSEARPPWNHRSVLRYTLTCMPGDHNPAHCQFQ